MGVISPWFFEPLYFLGTRLCPHFRPIRTVSRPIARSSAVVSGNFSWSRISSNLASISGERMMKRRPDALRIRFISREQC